MEILNSCHSVNVCVFVYVSLCVDSRLCGLVIVAGSYQIGLNAACWLPPCGPYPLGPLG